MSVRVIQGDVREELPKLPADYFDCIVTSPPYYGLRDYGTATWEGGDPACDHKMPTGQRQDVGRSQIDGFHGSSKESDLKTRPFNSQCGKCGARRIDAQIGLEPTLDAYLETMVAVCRELRRVLKPSGVFFLNIADSYQKDKCLCLMPQQLGILLKEDGWWVRSHIIWSKPNPMPESVTDRPTSAHETIWMLTKSARYFWDAEAVKENADCHRPEGREFGHNRALAAGQTDRITGNERRSDAPKWADLSTRNIRNVWSIASHPFLGAHFATFPPALVERCIKAGSSERGCCPACGAPWVRVVETDRIKHAHTPGKGARHVVPGSETSSSSCFRTGLVPINKTIGWQSSCRCPLSPPTTACILDPFAGSGTVGLVADRLGRDATLIDLNTSYIDMAVNRIRDDAPLFAEVAAE